MALFAAAARRAATSYLPLIRASVSAGGIALLRPLPAAAARPMPFSSATGVKPSSDDELPRVIKPETKLALQCDDHDPVRSAEPPESPARNQKDEGEKHPKKYTRHMTCVHVMNDESSVKFSYTIYHREHKIVIKALALRPPPPWDHESDKEVDFTDSEEVDFTESKEVDFTQPQDLDFSQCAEVDFSESEEVIEFSKLDVKLQHALYTLVEPLGNDTPEITELLQEHTMSKDQARLLFWETKLWDFLNKYEPMVQAPSMSPYKITDKGFETKSQDEILRMVSSALQFAANCGDRNRDYDKKKDIENLRRYLKLRRFPNFMQELIISKL